MVELTKQELQLITGVRFGDIYGNGGQAWRDLEGSEFNLDYEAFQRLKIAVETKDKIVKAMDSMKSQIDLMVVCGLCSVRRKMSQR